MKIRSLFFPAMIAGVLAMVAGCALFTPVSTDPVQAQTQQQTIAQQSQAITASINGANELLAELQATKSTPATTSPASPTTAPATATFTPASAVTVDKTAQALQLLTNAAQTLNTQIQTAPSVQAQQQAAFNVGVQTAQAAATTFGGPYGTLIAAGIGILAVVVQGVFHSKSQTAATQAIIAGAQSAHATAAAAVGAIAGSARFALAPEKTSVDGPGNGAAVASPPPAK